MMVYDVPHLNQNHAHFIKQKSLRCKLSYDAFGESLMLNETLSMPIDDNSNSFVDFVTDPTTTSTASSSP